MANTLLIIGDVLPFHFAEVWRRRKDIFASVRFVEDGRQDLRSYFARQGVDIIDTNDEVADRERKMRQEVLGHEKSIVTAILWGIDVRHQPEDYSWIFLEQNVALHAFAHVGEDHDPWVEFYRSTLVS